MTITTPHRPSAPDVIHDSGDPDALEPLIEEARTGSDQPDDPEALIEEAGSAHGADGAPTRPPRPCWC